MDVQTICLGILSLGESTGYEIKKQFEDGPFSHFFDAGFGSIYPALSKLEDQGFVTSRAEQVAGRPDRKVYAITPEGDEHFHTKLQAMRPAPDRFRSEFLAMMMFAERLDDAQQRTMIDEHIAELEQRLASIEASAAENNRQDSFVTDYGRTVLSASLNYLKSVRNTNQSKHVAAE